MSVTSLRSRSVGVGAGYSVSLLLALGMGLNACGTQGSSEQTALKLEGTTPQTYQEWCADWQLNCRVPDPGKTSSLSAAQFQALSTILNSALTSPSVFSVTRQELDADSLKQALTALHLEAVYQDIQTRLDASQWQSAGLENGALVSRHATATSLRTAEGLVWNLEPVQNVTFMPGAIQLSGLGLSADAAKEATVLQSMTVASDETFSLGLNDRSVQQVPLDFALDNLLLAFGLDVTQVSDQEIALPDIIAAGGPLVSWLNQSSRQITLQRPFFATASGQLGTLLPKDNMGQALGNLLSRFETLRTSSDAKNNLGAVSLVKGMTAKCDMNNGEIKVKFSPEFGVKRIYQPSPSTLGLEFYGVEASAKKALGIPLKLKRVELSADKITILDVPLIGKVDVKLDDISNPDQPTVLACGA